VSQSHREHAVVCHRHKSSQNNDTSRSNPTLHTTTPTSQPYTADFAPAVQLSTSSCSFNIGWNHACYPCHVLLPLRPQYPQNRKYITHRNAARERPSGHGHWQDVHKFGEVWCSTNVSKQTDKHTYSLQHFTAICEDKVMREKISDITDLCGAPYNTAMQRNATHPI